MQLSSKCLGNTRPLLRDLPFTTSITHPRLAECICHLYGVPAEEEKDFCTGTSSPVTRSHGAMVGVVPGGP